MPGETGLAADIDKLEIVGAASSVSTGFVYAGAKLEGSAITCADIDVTAGGTADIVKAPGSLSGKSPITQ